MTQCSNKRRAAGLAYPRTCSVCGLGPCRETTALNPPEPTTNTVKHTPDAREWQDISTAPHGNDASSPYVLLINRRGIMAVGCWVDDGDWYLPGGGLWKDVDLTHWMPLPPAPQEKGGE